MTDKSKSWIEENYPLENYTLYSDICLNEHKRDAIEEVCKKIMEKAWERHHNNRFGLSVYDIKDIIKELGVDL